LALRRILAQNALICIYYIDYISIIIIYLPAKHDTVHKVETNILSARHTRLIEHLQ